MTDLSQNRRSAAEPVSAFAPNRASASSQTSSAHQTSASSQTSSARNRRSPLRRLRSEHEPRFPLRASLVVMLLLISAFGMSVTGAVVTSTLRDFMLTRLDSSLDAAAHTPWVVNGEVPPMSTVLTGSRLPTDFYIQVQYSNGAVSSYAYDFDSIPNLDSISTATGPVTVPASPGSRTHAHWRAIGMENERGELIIVATSLDNVERTISRLVFLQVFIGVIVLLILFALSWALVRRSLRPLTEVEETAGKIARGDLDQRLPAWPTNTEVGHLADSLNIMLERIQASFDQVEESEKNAQDAAAKSQLAAEQAREAEETMRQFIADASHELRTPLTSVRGFAELIRSGATDDYQGATQRISDEATRMSLLVEDLLALARMDQQRPIAQQPVDLCDMSMSVVQALKVSHPDRHIELSNSCQELPTVVGDSARLHQVLTNLVNNAIKHAGEDASVFISLKETTYRDAPAVQIDVADDGIGISPEDCARVFNRFYRADDGSRCRSDGGGSGLGLAIVKGLVEAHGGEVTIASEVGKGTTFTVVLPRASEPPSAVAGN